MLTLDAILRIPAHVSFSVVGEDAFLLNAQTHKYYGLEKVGARLWQILIEGKSLSEAHQTLLSEYNVAADELERDILDLVKRLQEQELVEVIEA
ncbi:MAG: PqqD family protein [Anaerolineales bacterium]|nr:PqqD family protein [Anaerolineales bacterium]